MSDREGRADPPQLPGIKVLESLKKHLLESPESPSKPLSSREVCSSFTDLVEAVFTAAQRPNSSQVVSGAVELLVHACGGQDRDIRLAAQENLHKLVKGLISSHLSRLQQDLFHELKKSGSSRSLAVAVEVFARLYPMTRPSRCQSLSQNFFPVLLRLLAREEEVLHDTLKEALSLILPTMTPFVTTNNVQVLMSNLFEGMSSSPASYRRMAAATLHTLILHTRQPHTHAEWLVSKMLSSGRKENASAHLCQGILLTLQHLFSSLSDLSLSLSTQKQLFAFVLSCVLYRDQHTVVAALEALHTLLSVADTALAQWLTASQPNAVIATAFWGEVEREGEEEGDKKSISSGDTQSLGEGLNDSYFAPSDPDSESALLMSLIPDPPEAMPPVAADSGPAPQAQSEELACLSLRDGPPEPLASLVQYLREEVLMSSRVSAQSLVLACMSAIVDLQPSLLPSLHPYLPFTTAHDPKLKSRAVKLLAVLIKALLRVHRGDCQRAGAILSEACSALNSMLGDSTPVVLKAVCEALQLCLPSLATSSQPATAVAVIELLLPFRSSPYWLAKVELLKTVSCLPLTALSISQPQLPRTILTHVVFSLLGDQDHRVRTAAAEAMVTLASCLQLTSRPLLAHAYWEASQTFAHLLCPSQQLSLASIGDATSKSRPSTPLGLQHMLWFLLGNISSSLHPNMQRGCLESLHALSQAFPPPCLPEQWDCLSSPSTLLTTTISLLTASHLAWTVHGHYQLLEVTGSVFLASSLSSMKHSAQTGQKWCALSEPELAGHAQALLRHTARLLCLFTHIIEGREPEHRDSRLQRVPIVSPKKSPLREGSPIRISPAKPKVQIIETLQKPLLVPRDGIGQFATLHHYLKIMDVCRSAYTNYQVSLSPVGEDKFSQLLQATHTTLAAVLEVALAGDIGKHVEELMNYLSHTSRVDHCGALLCVQQLLNALFGMNAAAQHAYLYSPYLSSLPYDLSPLPSLSASLPSSATPSLTEVTISNPLSLLEGWLESPPPHTLLSPSSESPPQRRKYMYMQGLLPNRRVLVVKPVNSVSSVKDYIGYFEPLVVSVVKHFPQTSSILLQQRILFLLVQLLQLKVRYELLDCNHTFLDSVLKLVGLMESGMVRGGEELVPYLFQFLVLLAYDNSQLVSVPQVMQRCDGVMASGHSVTTFAIPALQPLVLNLFVRPSKDTSELETQQEVVLSMLLRVVEHSRVLMLLTHVLECYSRSPQHWQRVSSQIYASLLAQISKLTIVLDSQESLATLYQLLSAMDPSSINMKALFIALLKQSRLRSVQQLTRWLGVLSTALILMLTLFPDSTLYSELSCQQLAVPAVSCVLVGVAEETYNYPIAVATPTRLAGFFLSVLVVAGEAQKQLSVQRHTQPHPLLPQLIGNILLSLQSLVSGPYESLRSAFSSLPPHPTLPTTYLTLSSSHPLITLHYIAFALRTGLQDQQLIGSSMSPPLASSSPHSALLHNCVVPLVCEMNPHLPPPSLLPPPPPPPLPPPPPPPPAAAAATHSVISLFGASYRLDMQDTKQVQNLLEQLMKSDLSRPTHCLRALQLVHSLSSPHTLSFLFSHLIPHHLTPVSRKACEIALRIVRENEVSAELLQELLGRLEQHRTKCPELVVELEQRVRGSGNSPPSPYHHPLESSVVIESITELWYLSEVFELCQSCREPWLCGRVLGRLSEEQVKEMIENPDFRKTLVEACVFRGLRLSLSRETFRNSLDQEFAPSSSQPLHLHPLLQASLNCLLRSVREQPTDSSLLPALLWLLVSRPQLTSAIQLDQQTSVAIATLIRHSLKESCDHRGCRGDTLALQLALDCCSLALQTEEVCSELGDEWVTAVSSCLHSIINETMAPSVVAPVVMAPKVVVHVSKHPEVIASHPQNEAPSHLLHGLLTKYLSASLRPPLGLHVKTLLLSLARLPSLHTHTLTPPLLLSNSSDTVTEQVLDQALLEGEILQQYMARCNCVGWLTRPQFEERWMQLLGVVNQPPPPEGMPVEEVYGHTLNMCVGVVGVISLLLATSLRPLPGNPIASIPMHIHRNKDILFLGTNPGRRLYAVRQVVEQQIIQQCGARPDLYSHYQHPLLSHLSPSYPPLFTRNVERGSGETQLGPGQISLKSLWPIMLMTATSGRAPRYTSEGAEVDVRSCVLSLIDLFSHWLTQPTHTLLVQHMLRAVLMLSDLFAMSSQYEWMLQTAMELQECHPPEDWQTTALLLQCILKAAAVLRVEGQQVEKISKIVEKALASGSLQVQNGCLYGLLYITEDPGSPVVAQLGPLLAKYVLPHLENFHRHTELHIRLVWSLSISLALLHAQHLKDGEFNKRLLDRAIPLLLHPHTSTLTFHSITLGLELMVTNFVLTPEERSKVMSIAASRCVKCEQGKLLAALGLLVSCMYIGVQASGLSEVAEEGTGEEAVQTREHISVLMEHMRHGPLEDVRFLVDVIPVLLVEFLAPLEVLQMVVTEFVSPHQPRPSLAAMVMGESFSLLLSQNQANLLTDWVLLSMDSFVQQEPESKSVWCLACLLTAASTSPILRGMLEIIAYQPDLPHIRVQSLLCSAALTFYNQQASEHQQKTFVQKFQSSAYKSLNAVAHHCLHS